MARRREPSIPAEVLARLSDEQRADVLAERETREGPQPVEIRTVQNVETRDNSDGTWELRGYACVYDYPYPIAGGPENGGWTEIVSRGAASKSIADGADVRLLFDHEGIPLARTKSGTLTLRSDDNGLMACAPQLDAASPYAQSIRSAVLRKDADQMSFAFRVVDQKWNADWTVRTITQVALYDVSVVTYPASEATVVTMLSKKLDHGELRRGDLVSACRQIAKRAADEGAEDGIVEQIEILVAQLIQGEAQEIIDGGEAYGALNALLYVLYDLDWYETIDAYEDSLSAETDDDAVSAAAEQLSASLDLARRQADALRLRASL